MRHRRRQVVAIAALTVNKARDLPEVQRYSREQNGIQDVYDAREKAQRLLADLARKRDDAASVLTQSFAKALNAKEANVDGMFTQYKTWEAQDDQLGQQVDAFMDLNAMLMNRWAFFKTHYPKDVLIVLTAKLEHLGEVYRLRETETQQLRKRIEGLAVEIKTLTEALPNVPNKAESG
ncbi:MAG TPA: hypothetical protein VJ692_07200 [Nitrospiraceae bacterium]|nr:hypothetical protein [Nitrospiraceae bacterium]